MRCRFEVVGRVVHAVDAHATHLLAHRHERHRNRQERLLFVLALVPAVHREASGEVAVQLDVRARRKLQRDRHGLVVRERRGLATADDAQPVDVRRDDAHVLRFAVAEVREREGDGPRPALRHRRGDRRGRAFKVRLLRLRVEEDGYRQLRALGARQADRELLVVLARRRLGGSEHAAEFEELSRRENAARRDSKHLEVAAFGHPHCLGRNARERDAAWVLDSRRGVSHNIAEGQVLHVARRGKSAQHKPCDVTCGLHGGRAKPRIARADAEASRLAGHRRVARCELAAFTRRRRERAPHPAGDEIDLDLDVRRARDAVWLDRDTRHRDLLARPVHRLVAGDVLGHVGGADRHRFAPRRVVRVVELGNRSGRIDHDCDPAVAGGRRRGDFADDRNR